MKYQIDQSGKIEQTNIKTIVSLTNSSDYAVVLSSNDKQLLENIFRHQQHPRLFPYLVFSALVSILINKTSPQKKVQIDEEYTGHNKLISEKINYYLGLLKVDNPPHIEFVHIRKLSKTHLFANKVGKGKSHNFYQVKLKEIISLILTNKK